MRRDSPYSAAKKGAMPSALDQSAFSEQYVRPRDDQVIQDPNVHQVQRAHSVCVNISSARDGSQWQTSQTC